MNCPKCQHKNAHGSNFCSGCGAKLQSTCPQCGVEVKPDDRFCSKCGGSLATSTTPPAAPEPLTLEEQFTTFQEGLPASFREQLLAQAEGENRVVTVLFADMSRSVEATEALHPEDAMALINRLLRAMVDVLLKYEGRVDRFLGDGVLAVFGTPQAHESDPERAVLAAMEIRDSARELGLEVTAGINTGEVYVGGIGSEQHQEVTVMGPVVNLASRLQGQAEPGQILVGAATYRLTRRAFEFSPLSLQLKGIAQPVTAHVVERALPRPEKARGIEGLRAELIGRDDELDRLKVALAELLNGQGQMVTLIGEAGVGKSRLVAELKALTTGHSSSVMRHSSGPRPDTAPMTDDASRMTNDAPRMTNDSGPLWLEGRCLELGMTASYWPFLDIFRQYFAWGSEESEPSRAERLLASGRELVSQGHLSETRFDEMVPLLGHLLSVRFGNEWDERLKSAGPEEIKHRTFMAIRDFFLALSRQQPLILVLEDLHWADSLSLDLISLLMETVTFAPLFLLCVYRPEREHKCWHLGTIAARKCSERYTEIALRELSATQSRRLVESLLSIDNLPPSVKDAILQKSGGNPFFVEEVVRSLMASGMVYQEADVWRAREGIETVTVPESIQSVIMSRVDRLEQELKQVLQGAAIIGRLFRRRLLEYTTRGATQLEQNLWELEEQALIYQERAVPEEEYSFKHVLTQETVYGSILRRRRAGFHQQVAEAIETLYQDGLEEYYEQLAYHYERSGADEKAIEYLLKAGERARRAYLNEEAIGYFQRALGRLDASPLGEARKECRLAALKGLGLIYHGIGKEPEAVESLRQAIALGKEIGLAPREIVRLLYWLAYALFWQGRMDEVICVGEEGLALLGDDTESVEAAMMNAHLAITSSQNREFNLRNARFLQRLPYAEELDWAYANVAAVYASEKNLEEATNWLQALERAARQHHDLKALTQMHAVMGANILAPSGDLRGAISQYKQAHELVEKTGDFKLGATCLSRLGHYFLSLGDLRAAEEYLSQALEIQERVGAKSFAVQSLREISTVELCQERGQRAAVACQKAIDLVREMGRSEAWSIHRLGRVYLAQGEREGALREFRGAIALLGCASPESLSALEEAYQDPDAFRAFCLRFREEHPEAGDAAFAQWFLQPTKAQDFAQRQLFGDFTDTLSPEWSWRDPFGDCSFTVQNGLEIHAANGRDLWHVNLSAPRLLRPASGDHAAQTVCVPASDEKPAIGGLLLWRDQQNYLRLDRGSRGKHEISFQGCIGNKDAILGRGRLPSERTHLRLERQAGRVRALCSADGQEWFTVGEVEFPVEDPVEVGLHAIGSIDRLIYPGAYPEGTAIRFESFELWGA